MKMKTTVVRLLVLLTSLAVIASPFEFKYRNYDSLTHLLKWYNTTYPANAFLQSIGKSIQGRDIWVISIASQAPDSHMSLRPEVKYVGGFHGNEQAGKETLLAFIDYLLNNRTDRDPDVEFLLSHTRMHILPLMNPDGGELARPGDCLGNVGRNNSNNVDLNRNFPDLFSPVPGEMQPETQAVIQWFDQNSFMLGGDVFTDALMVNYPYDGYPINTGPKYSATSDDDVFRRLASTYADLHPDMKNPQSNPKCWMFNSGINNGATDGSTVGAMQDFNYWRYGCMTVSIGINCCNNPPAEQLETVWLKNRKSMIEYFKKADTGVKGVIAFQSGLRGKFLTVKIDAREPYFKTNVHGEFYRILLPGQYKLSVAIECENVFETSFVIQNGSSSALQLNVTLSDSLIGQYNRSSLDRYGIFCSKKNNGVKLGATLTVFITVFMFIFNIQ